MKQHSISFPWDEFCSTSGRRWGSPYLGLEKTFSLTCVDGEFSHSPVAHSLAHLLESAAVGGIPKSKTHFQCSSCTMKHVHMQSLASRTDCIYYITPSVAKLLLLRLAAVNNTQFLNLTKNLPLLVHSNSHNIIGICNTGCKVQLFVFQLKHNLDWALGILQIACLFLFSAWISHHILAGLKPKNSESLLGSVMHVYLIVNPINFSGTYSQESVYRALPWITLGLYKKRNNIFLHRRTAWYLYAQSCQLLPLRLQSYACLLWSKSHWYHWDSLRNV